MIRISGGKYRGRQIACPKGKAVRPTTAFVRESLFSILGPRMADSHWLDMFAGCGIVGIEALSRGAQRVTVVDKASGHCRLLEQNREALRIPPETYRIVCQDAFAWLNQQPDAPASPYDFIFLDPPYALTGVEAWVSGCFAKKLLAPEGWLIWERGSQIPADIPHAQLMDTRHYGTSNLYFFTYPD